MVNVHKVVFAAALAPLAAFGSQLAGDTQSRSALSSLVSPLNQAYEDLKCQLCEVPQLQGTIDGCCCDAKTAERSNNAAFLPILHELTKT
jgi:hypothetical protein